jgi:hypothetical protein
VAAEVAAHVNFNGRRKLFATLSGRAFPGDTRQLSDEQRRAEAELARDFLLSLSLGNTVFPQPDEKTGVPVLKGSSPDEEALVEVSPFPRSSSSLICTCIMFSADRVLLCIFLLLRLQTPHTQPTVCPVLWV